MTRSLAVSALAVAVTVAAVLFFGSIKGEEMKGTEIFVGEEPIFVETADTPEERARGLSGRASLKEDEGMLFIFKEPGRYPFWMKDMLFAIDIIWIDENFKIIGIEENLSPDTFPRAFSPSEPVKYVLETSAGWSKKNSIRVGDNVEKINFLE